MCSPTLAMWEVSVLVKPQTLLRGVHGVCGVLVRLELTLLSFCLWRWVPLPQLSMSQATITRMLDTINLPLRIGIWRDVKRYGARRRGLRTASVDKLHVFHASWSNPSVRRFLTGYCLEKACPRALYPCHQQEQRNRHRDLSAKGCLELFKWKIGPRRPLNRFQQPRQLTLVRFAKTSYTAENPAKERPGVRVVEVAQHEVPLVDLHEDRRAWQTGKTARSWAALYSTGSAIETPLVRLRSP